MISRPKINKSILFYIFSVFVIEFVFVFVLFVFFSVFLIWFELFVVLFWSCLMLFLVWYYLFVFMCFRRKPTHLSRLRSCHRHFFQHLFVGLHWRCKFDVFSWKVLTASRNKFIQVPLWSFRKVFPLQSQAWFENWAFVGAAIWTSFSCATPPGRY